MVLNPDPAKWHPVCGMWYEQYTGEYLCFTPENRLMIIDGDEISYTSFRTYYHGDVLPEFGEAGVVYFGPSLFEEGESHWQLELDNDNTITLYNYNLDLSLNLIKVAYII